MTMYRMNNSTKVATVGGVTGSDLENVKNEAVNEAVNQSKTYTDTAMESGLVLLTESRITAQTNWLSCAPANKGLKRDFYYVQFAAETAGSGSGFLGLNHSNGNGANAHWWGVAAQQGQISFLNVENNPRFFDLPVDGSNQGISGWMKITSSAPTTWWNYTYMISRADYGVRMGGGRLNYGAVNNYPEFSLECTGLKMGSGWVKIFGLKSSE